MRAIIFLLGASLFFFGCSHATKVQEPAVAKDAVKTAETAKQQATVSCALSGTTRTLRIESVQPQGCKLFYSNYKGNDPVASSEVSSTRCENIRDRIMGKLEAAGYKCSAAPANVTAPAPTSTPVAK